jgi:type I restriction enzyme S subunit
MDLKSGYKHSEFGFIPVEWDISTISDCVESNGLIRGPFGGALKKEFFVPSGYKVYEQKNAIYKSIELGQYYIDKEKFVELSRFQIKANDFIVSCSGTIGRIYLIPKQHKEGVINQALLIIRINSSKCCRAFFEHCFNSDWFQAKIIDGTQGGAMKNLVGMAEFKMSTFPSPPLEEQKAIAQVLSDFDNLIDGLERLIAKKRSIKEGVMQELLRPKEGWVVRKLTDVARLYNGYAFKSADYVAVGDYKIITIANVQEGHMTYTGTSRLEKLPFDIQAHQKLELGEILVSMTGNVGRVCKVNIENALLNQRVGKIVGYGISPSFLFSVLNTKDFQNRMIELAQGGAQGNIGKWDILNFEFCAPGDLSEQDKIAQTIGDFDEELSLLEGKLSKYNQIKQGVMNELLTGKTRLV